MRRMFIGIDAFAAILLAAGLTFTTPQPDAENAHLVVYDDQFTSCLRFQ